MQKVVDLDSRRNQRRSSGAPFLNSLTTNTVIKWLKMKSGTIEPKMLYAKVTRKSLKRDE